MLHHFRRGALRHNIQYIATLPLAGMGLYRHLLRCGIFCPIGVGLRLIRHERQLVHQPLFKTLRGCPKLPLLGKTKLLQKPLVLELQLSQLRLLRIIFRPRNGHHFRGAYGSVLLMFHE